MEYSQLKQKLVFKLEIRDQFAFRHSHTNPIYLQTVLEPGVCANYSYQHYT